MSWCLSLVYFGVREFLEPATYDVVLYIFLFIIFVCKVDFEKSQCKRPNLTLYACHVYNNELITFAIGRNIHWQEMSVHWRCFYQGPYSCWYLPQCEDDEDHHCSTQLSSLCQEIPEVGTDLIEWIFVLRAPFSCMEYNIKLYCHSRYEKRHSNIPAHISPCFRVKEGDHVIIGQCRLV